MRPKTKLFAVKFRRILKVLCLRVLQKRCGCNSTIFASKNEAVCREIETHSGSSRIASFKENVVVQFNDLRVQKWNCLLWNSDAFWKFSACEFYRKSCRRDSTIYASKSEAVCCEVQMHFGISLPASFKEKVVSAIPRFVCPKTKLFALKFRRILKVLCLRVLQKVLCAIPWFVWITKKNFYITRA